MYMFPAPRTYKIRIFIYFFFCYTLSMRLVMCTQHPQTELITVLRFFRSHNLILILYVFVCLLPKFVWTLLQVPIAYYSSYIILCKVKLYRLCVLIWKHFYRLNLGVIWLLDDEGVQVHTRQNVYYQDHQTIYYTKILMKIQ
jgi:hypothetical protein